MAVNKKVLSNQTSVTALESGELNRWHMFLSVAILVVLFAAMMVGRAMTGEAHNVSARSPAELYARNCASCHGKDGKAKTFKGKLKHARDLTDPTWQGNVGDERLFNSIMNGKGKMPAYSKKLSEQEIDSLVTYVRALKK
jgi:mono/diheme cytochrome c family protein